MLRDPQSRPNLSKFPNPSVTATPRMARPLPSSRQFWRSFAPSVPVTTERYFADASRRELPTTRHPSIKGTADGKPSPIEDVCVDHRGCHVPVAEELLNGSDIVPRLEKMRGKRVPERVAARSLGESGREHGRPNVALKYGLVKVVEPSLPPSPLLDKGVSMETPTATAIHVRRVRTFDRARRGAPPTLPPFRGPIRVAALPARAESAMALLRYRAASCADPSGPSRHGS